MADEEFLARIAAEFRQYKQKAERALAQVSDEDWFRRTGPEDNSLADLLRHLSGNLRSRWRNFLTADGEKPDRHRDTEFKPNTGETAEQLMARWEAAWEIAFTELAQLRPEDMMRTVTIRTIEHSVPQAILRNLTHCSYHVGQIVLLAKHFAGERWQTLSIPRRRPQ